MQDLVEENIIFKLIEALYNKDISQLNDAINNGAPINSCIDQHQLTPLHYAVILNFHDAIQLLIQAGADISARTDTETRLLTPKQVANLFGYSSIEKIIDKYDKNHYKKTHPPFCGTHHQR